ncbi:MAG: adenylate/guanylate cyclase domain-containing protein [Nanoarchaeota archaeon]|nr:adenylate/guanylate cyclase domain-containing protein [Nanoarchaeota archaeon]MBU1621958.1 adenylate/guanylate cyclase domain-containing protein [Nanoarchaeota archaeon]
MTPEKVESEVLTIMFVDLVGYTKTTGKLKREDISGLHDVFDSICASVFDKYSGNVIKKMGDAFLVTFKSPTNAVLCGVELQNDFKRYNKQYKLKNPLSIRVALHGGEVVLRKGDIYGDAVNTAARIESIVKAGDVVFSEAVYHSMNKNEIPYLYLGAKKFKGVRRPIKIFKVKRMYDEILRRRKKFAKSVKRKIRNLIVTVLLLVFLGAVVYGIYWYLQNNSGFLV